MIETSGYMAGCLRAAKANDNQIVAAVKLLLFLCIQLARDDYWALAAERTLLLDRAPLDCGYATFSIRKSLQKADYGEIPDLEEHYVDIQNAIKAGKEKDAQDALTAFRLSTVASPDLIPSDARKLVEKVNQMVTEAFPPPGATAARPSAIPAKALSAIRLYD